MGFRIAASCDCGYETEFSVGGTMSSFRSVNNFPHYCKNCGLVVVNVFGNKVKRSKQQELLSFLGIKQDATEVHLCCPKCNSQDILQYGKKPMTCDDQPEAQIRSFDYVTDIKNNFCPSCEKYTLVFAIAAFVD